MNKSLNELSDDELEILINSQKKLDPTKFTSDYSKGQSSLLGALEGATLGFFPKIAGAVTAPIRKFTNPYYQNQSLSDIYAQSRDEFRNEMRSAREQNPLSSLAGDFVGSALLPFPAKTLGQGAKLGALYGGLYGLGTNDENLNETNALNILGNAALGSGLGALGTYGSQLLSRERIGPTTDQQTLLDISKRFDIPATYGELTRDPANLLKEEAALKGRIGDANQKNLAEFKNLQQEKISGAAESLRNQLGNQEFTSKGEAAGEAIRNLQKQALDERKGFSEAYKKAKDQIAILSKDNFQDFQNNLKTSLTEEVITADNAPKAFSEISALENILEKQPGKNVNIKQLEAWRQGLNQTYRSALNTGDEKTAFALNKIKNNFDQFLENNIENALLDGDTETLKEFQKARKLAANWYQKYGDSNSKNFGKKFISDMVERARANDQSLTDEMVVNKIFGTSEMGFKPEAAIIAKELKKNSAPEDFNKIKLEAAQKLLSPLMQDKPSAAKYSTGLNKFFSSNQTLAKELFSNNEIKQLNDLKKISESILTREKSLVNPSGTAEVVLDFLQKKTGTGFLKNIFNKIDLDQKRIFDRINKGEVVKKEPSIVFKLPNIDLTENKENDSINAALKTTSSNTLEEGKADNLPSAEVRDNTPINDQKIKLINKISLVESGNNPNAKNKNSSASGLLQFTDSTWKSMVDKYGAELGVTLQDKNNPEAQKLMGYLLLEENENYLQNLLGRAPTDGELYLAHFMGPKNTAKLLKASPNQIAAKIMPNEAKANKNIFFAKWRPRTTSEVYDLITTKI